MATRFFLMAFLAIITQSAFSQQLKRIEFNCEKDSLGNIFYHQLNARQKLLRACRFNELNAMLGYKTRLKVFKVYKDDKLIDCELFWGKNLVNIDTSSRLRIFMHQDWGTFLSTETLKDGSIRVIQTAKEEQRIYTFQTVKPAKKNGDEHVISSLIPAKIGPYREFDLEGNLLLEGQYKLIDSVSYDTIQALSSGAYSEHIEIIKNEKTSVKSGVWNTYDRNKQLIARRRYRF